MRRLFFAKDSGLLAQSLAVIAVLVDISAGRQRNDLAIAQYLPAALAVACVVQQLFSLHISTIDLHGYSPSAFSRIWTMRAIKMILYNKK